jgi:hypothetical protein
MSSCAFLQPLIYLTHLAHVLSSFNLVLSIERGRDKSGNRMSREGVDLVVLQPLHELIGGGQGDGKGDSTTFACCSATSVLKNSPL